jgi:hypothetical protein
MPNETINSFDELSSEQQQPDFTDISSQFESIDEAHSSIIDIQNAWRRGEEPSANNEDFSQICDDYYTSMIMSAHTTEDERASLTEGLETLQRGFNDNDRETFDRARQRCDRVFKAVQERATHQAEEILIPDENTTIEQICAQILESNGITADSEMGQRLLNENLAQISEASQNLTNIRQTREQWADRLAGARLDRTQRETMIKIRTNVSRARKLERKAAYKLAKIYSEFNELARVSQSNEIRDTNQVIQSETQETGGKIHDLLDDKPTKQEAQSQHVRTVIESVTNNQSNIINIVNTINTRSNIVEQFSDITNLYNDAIALMDNMDDVRVDALRDSFSRTTTRALTNRMTHLTSEILSEAETQPEDDINRLQVRRSYIIQAIGNIGEVVSILGNSEGLSQVRGTINALHVRMGVRNRALADEIKKLEGENEEVIELTEDDIDTDAETNETLPVTTSISFNENENYPEEKEKKQDTKRRSDIFLEQVAQKVDLGMAAFVLNDILPEFAMNAHENAKGKEQSEIHVSMNLQVDKDNNKAYITIEDDGEISMPLRKNRILEAAQYQGLDLPEGKDVNQTYEWDQMVDEMVNSYHYYKNAERDDWGKINQGSARLTYKDAEAKGKEKIAGGLGTPLFVSARAQDMISSHHYERINGKNRIILGFDIG